ncbi:MAG: IS66 family transposase [Bacteroidota bacterium]|nr:IS66 family transposase [Bacteroidota bacterium]
MPVLVLSILITCMEATSIIENLPFRLLYEQEKKEKESLKIEVMKLQLQLHKLTQIVFGSKSERFTVNPAQLTLDIKTDEAPAVCNLSQTKKIEYIKTGTPKKRDLPELSGYMEHLDHVYETREPENIPEGSIKIGEEQHSILEHTPGKVFVRVIVIPKYKIPSAPGSEKTEIIAAPAPQRPLTKCFAGASMLAQMLVDKYCDHLPLYRQLQRFERNGVSIPYNTYIEWTGKAIKLLSVMGDALLKELLQSGYIHADETGLKVLLGKESGKERKIHDGFIWSYHSSIENLVYFDYQPGRGVKHAIGILQNFEGVLQTDGWQVYEGVVKKQNNIIQICCMAHARRKFTDAMPYSKDLGEIALTKFQALYDIERRCKEEKLSYDEITKVRQREAVPILNELHEWMLAQYKTQLPSSPIATAIQYSLERWERLCYYTTDGRLNIDNNPVERSIRPIALGRKNYMFAGSHKAAERLAMIYSLLGTCKLNDVNPYEWLTDVLNKINDWPINKIHELLPHHWKAARSHQTVST